MKLPYVKKPLPRKQIFVQTPYSHSTLKGARTIDRKTTDRKQKLGQ